MTPQERFFYDHAGYSYDPTRETAEEGKLRCAQGLARAETWALGQGYYVSWEDDWEIGSHVDEFDTYTDEPTTCEVALLRDPCHNVVVSLGCIDDADDAYRRVVAAELAWQVMDMREAAPLLGGRER